MKTLLQKTTLVLAIFLISSCSSVKVASDYDKNTNFNDYKTFAFLKSGIDKAEINDLDKRRILRAIESDLIAKGFTKSENPDMLVSIFTKAREKVNVYNNGVGPYYYNWNWTPWYWNNYNMISKSTEGILYIDLIDAKKRELVWQGQGTGYLVTKSKKVEKKEERINEFVEKIMVEYPPALN
ncbi:DUF4136 domain-containing protein [Ichthyenterobacterium sp. W332]|uniref:DUF4136 domain-containing protein n=1 Tax=Microcosmobacter mediterraneus TaxID=3075607 RepID=A0ABU2YLN6_9FLAO|nr:DUF4136 domain-containing protein [Ichthyenterobacterium sp. W332]MDT0559070.1 DUF4136 domain-containing protein [Ichthyenterobacterium sp. W332]